MRERPILFSDPMVRAILAGRKTVTRRIVKPQPPEYLWDRRFAPVGKGGTLWAAWADAGTASACRAEDMIRCPYGAPGDRLWVREAWRVGAWRNDGRIAIDYRATPEIVRTPWINVSNAEPSDAMMTTFGRLALQSAADCMKAGAESDGRGGWRWEHGKSPCRWRSSMFMPRWASRLTLEIVSVRVERLQAISEEDARAEGVESNHSMKWPDGDPGTIADAHRRNFAALWDRINGDRASWASNPWVWRIEFRRIEAAKEAA